MSHVCKVLWRAKEATGFSETRVTGVVDCPTQTPLEELPHAAATVSSDS